MTQQDDNDDRHGLVIGGTIVLGLGLVFLLSNLEIIPHFGQMWPLVLVVIGIALLIGAVIKKEKGESNDHKGIHHPPT